MSEPTDHEQAVGPYDPYYDDPAMGLDPCDYPALACHECSGTGQAVGACDEDVDCPSCGGSGWGDDGPPEDAGP